MIENEQQLNQCIEQLERMYRALAELRSRVLPSDPIRYQLMAEGPADEVRRLQSEIETYLQVETVTQR